uniref:CCDC66 domain-containing protein n=1 Tax=Spongospora subterranea TaxID=70186 RepID=A0A0H5RCL9_9EUKA|eukprot:CRZ11496.1 hypothetical protein [Spongospora subterranea]
MGHPFPAINQMGVTAKPPARPARRSKPKTPGDAPVSRQYCTISATALSSLIEQQTATNASSTISESPQNQSTFRTSQKHEVEQISQQSTGNQQKTVSEPPRRAELTRLDKIDENNEYQDKGANNTNNSVQSGSAGIHLPAIHALSATTKPRDEFANNRLKSTRGCALVHEDEFEKRARQKALLKEQIEERKRAKQLEEEKQARIIREEDERVQTELRILQKRWEQEIENERLQAVKKRERDREWLQVSKKVSAETTQPPPQTSPVPVLLTPADRIQPMPSSHRHQKAQSSAADVKPAHNVSLTGATPPSQAPIGVSEMVALRPNFAAVPRNPAPSKELLDLGNLCKRLLIEQEQFKKELLEQKMQTKTVKQQKAANEALTEQIHDLQAQIYSLTSHDRAKARVREHRRKENASEPGAEGRRCDIQREKPSRNLDKEGSTSVPGRARAAPSRKRGSWATRSKAGAPAPRASVSMVAAGVQEKGEEPELEDDLELGSSTKLIYPGDSLWDMSDSDIGAFPPNPKIYSALEKPNNPPRGNKSGRRKLLLTQTLPTRSRLKPVIAIPRRSARI